MIDRTDPTNRDTVPAMLTPGEFVLNKEAVQLFGPKIEAMNKQGLALRQHENDGGHIGNFNMGGVIKANQYNNGGQIPGYNWGGWISSLLEPDENSVIGQQQAGELLPAHIRAVPPGYGAEAPVPQPEFVPQAQPGQQVQGGFGAGIPEEFSGAYRPERRPTYITDIPQEGAGAQHDRSTIIPTEASIPYIKGEQAGLVPPTQADVIQQQAEQVVPGTDEALLQTSSDYANDIVSQAGTGAQHGRDDIVTTNPFFDADRDGSYFTKTNEPLLETEYPDVPPAEVPSIFQGYENYTPDDALVDAGVNAPPPVEGGPVDWNSLQGAGIPQGGDAVKFGEEVQDKVIQEATFKADNAIESAKAQEANMLAQAQAAADAGDFETANKLNQESQGIVAAAEQAKVESVGALEAQYAEGKQARLDAENQWRESQGLPPKPSEAEIEAEAAANAEAEAVTYPDNPPAGIKPDSIEAQGNVQDIVSKADADPNANPNVNEAVAQEATANVSPKQKSEGIKAVKESMGGLMDNKELLRAGLLFAGALLTGASPQQALAIAGKSYLAGQDRKDAEAGKAAALQDKRVFQLAKAGKHTPESVKAYQESGDPTDLVEKVDPATGAAPAFTQTGQFEEWYDKSTGKQVQVQKVKVGKNNIYLDQNGQQVSKFGKTTNASQAKHTPEYRERIQAESKEYAGIFKEMQDLSIAGQEDGAPITGLSPKVTGSQIAGWAVENDVPVGGMSQLISNAYEDAKRDSKGKKVKSIVPYLNAQYVKTQVGDSSSQFQLKNGSSVDATKVNDWQGMISNSLKQANPETFGNQSDFEITQFVLGTKASQDWFQLPEDERARQTKLGASKGQSGYMYYIQEQLQP